MEDRELTLEQLDLVRRRIVNVVGHELRTPVTTLRGLVRQLATSDQATLQDSLIPALRRNCDRLEHLLDDLLIASRITTALPIAAPQPLDLAEAVWAAWEEVRPGADRVLVVEGGPALAVLDRATVVHALTHVVDNAAVYGTSAVTTATVSIDPWPTIRVTSTGAALGADDVALAFELFYRGERAVTTAAGLGVGLTAARVAVEAIGGTIRLVSTDEVTTVTLEWP